MRVSAHQPGYHRHLYYFYKMAVSDVFVSLDHVQFARSDWQNRQAFVYGGARRWLTLPVRSGRDPIREKTLADPAAVLASHWDRIASVYKATPYFGDYEEALGAVYAAPWTHLIDLCDALTHLVRGGLGITTPYLRGSDLVGAAAGTKGTMLAEAALRAAAAVPASRRASPVTYLACAHPVRPDHYLRRPSREDPGRTEYEVMEARGVRVRAFDYRHPRYAQAQHPADLPFQAELTAFDLLFNHGPEARSILLGGGPGKRPRLYPLGGK
ncbi:WbqC family protein [Streptomyces sp. NPDC059564]|uniref:WbqC family protein n=1 Tax=Streptomyces sp. NPDC059564 TaxID=3346865 RepID=UPI00367605C2